MLFLHGVKTDCARYDSWHRLTFEVKAHHGAPNVTLNALQQELRSERREPGRQHREIVGHEQRTDNNHYRA